MAGKRPKSQQVPDGNWLGREVFGLLGIFFGLLLLLSLATFDVRDPYINQVVTGTAKIHNKAGLFGAYSSGILLDAFGFSAWLIPLFICLFGARRVMGATPWPKWRWSGILLLVLCIAFLGAARDIHVLNMPFSFSELGQAAGHGGGFLGFIVYTALVSVIGVTGATLAIVFLFFLAIQLLLGFSWLPLLAHGARALWNACSSMAKNIPRQHKTSQARYTALPESSATTGGEPPLKVLTMPSDIEQLPSKKRDEGWVVRKREDLVSMPATQEEPDVPPWVKDFESGALGLENPLPLQKEVPYEEERAIPLAAPLEEESGWDPFEPMGQTEAMGYIPIADPVEVEAAPEEKSPSLLQKVFTPEKRCALPALEFLEAVTENKKVISKDLLEAKGRSLMTCLSDFGISCDLVGITPGPVVTMFELRPAPGVRVSRIANLSDDLALALKAVSVRIQAPVPGTDLVGIEIPNENRETVCFKELIGSQCFKNSTSLLTLGLGKEISGAAAVADLATMPHLLMAGATGAGKSVGINSILLSILFKSRPDQVKLLLIDPKRVELAIYADLPHLVHPVVTDMAMAKSALEWAVKEMERRYEDIALAGVRNIKDYNAKLLSFGKKVPEALAALEPMPYLVIVIDELADLMMVAAKEVETSIVRLAQLARAAGIHLILATQRPSVDVVTGIIKANFPCRISFQVTSKHDSRTILDAVGAEHLLGKGDMLYKPGGGKVQRIHGAFVSDTNVQAVCDYWRSKMRPEYWVDLSDWGAGQLAELAMGNGGETYADPLYNEACEFVRQQGKVSISLIQRRFRIGFNKAANFVEQMEQDGIISAADGSKPRTVIR